LLDKDFHSVTAVLEAVGKTSESGVAIAQEALKWFQPALILNRMTPQSRINTLQLQHLLKQYVGTDLSILGNIPEDIQVQQSILKYLPVVELAPSSSATIALKQIADNVLEMVGQTPGSIGRMEEPRKIRA
nr:hypothetical protein [Nitrospirales bacterium]